MARRAVLPVARPRGTARGLGLDATLLGKVATCSASGRKAVGGIEAAAYGRPSVASTPSDSPLAIAFQGFEVHTTSGATALIRVGRAIGGTHLHRTTGSPGPAATASGLTARPAASV